MAGTDKASGRPEDLAVDDRGVRVFGVHYSWAVFQAMGRRMPPGSRLDVESLDGGPARLYSFTPEGGRTAR